MEFLKGKKTYIIAVLLGLVAVVQVIVGDMSLTEFFNSPQLLEILAAFGLGTLRGGVAKVK